MTASFHLKPNGVHPALIASLNDFDYKRDEARAKSLRGFMGTPSFFLQLIATFINCISLLLQLMTPNPLTPIVVGLNIFSLGLFGMQIVLWRIRLPSFYNADVLETAKATLRKLIVDMNTTAPSLQSIFQELEPTIAQGDIVWVTHVYNTLRSYDAVKHHTEHMTSVAYDQVVGHSAPVEAKMGLKV